STLAPQLDQQPDPECDGQQSQQVDPAGWHGRGRVRRADADASEHGDADELSGDHRPRRECAAEQRRHQQDVVDVGRDEDDGGGAEVGQHQCLRRFANSLSASAVAARIWSASAWRYGLPSGWKISWCQTTGGCPVYGFCQLSHGKLVCVLPSTKPQLMTPTSYLRAMGSELSNVDPAPRARYSVQMMGRPYFWSCLIRRSNTSGQL